MRYEFSKPAEYRRMKETVPIAYIPWGAHEWHGVHNPLGLDTMKAHGMCLALCAETGGVVFPAVYCGTHTMKPYRGFDCTLNFSAECVRILADQYLDQLADEGFKVIVILMGHYGADHQAVLKSAVEDFNARQDKAVAWAFPDYEMTVDDGIKGDHAGATETSYMLFLHPELVDLSRLPHRDIELDVDGIGGQDPRQASSKLGRDGINALVKNAAIKVNELLAKMEDTAP